MNDIEMATMVVVIDKPNNKILMLDRKKNWLGYAPPGGHLEHPESFVECAIREVKEETGIDVFDLQYKGFLHWVNEKTKHRMLVFNYYTENFSGTLCQGHAEGIPEWVDLDKVNEYPLSEGFKGRLEEMFFIDGTVEVHIVYDDEGKRDKNIYN